MLYRKRGLGSFVAKPVSQGVSGRTFALVIPFNTTQGGIFQAVKAANQIFSKLGHQLTIHIGQHRAVENTKLLESLYNQVDGIVYYPWGSDLPEEILIAFAQRKKPVIIMDKTNTHPEFSSVICDNYRGGYLLTEHLLSYGHTRICYLSRFKPEELSSIGERYRGYQDCLAASGSNAAPRFVHWDAEGKGQAQYYMLQHLVNTLRMEEVTAIICENDEAAFNVHLCCENLGYRIPQDMSIAGFDNIEWATTGHAQITTIDQNFVLIGESITAALLDEDYKPRNYTVPVQLIPRASTGKAIKN